MHGMLDTNGPLHDPETTFLQKARIHGIPFRSIWALALGPVAGLTALELLCSTCLSSRKTWGSDPREALRARSGMGLHDALLGHLVG